MKIQCPHCGVKGSADESYHGQKVQCPKCQGVFAAFSESTKASPEEQVLTAPPVEKPVMQDDLADKSFGEDAFIPGEQPTEMFEEKMPDDLLEGDNVLPVEDDISDIFADDDTSADDQQPKEPSAKLVAEQENVLDWGDIVSEIDKEMAEGVKSENEQQGDPADLNDFFKDTAPKVDDFVASIVQQPNDEPGEAGGRRAEVSPAGDESLPAATVAHLADLPKDQAIVQDALHGVEQQPYSMDKEQCWQCGKQDIIGVPFIAKDGRLYCPDCVPEEKPEGERVDAIASGFAAENVGNTDTSPEEPRYRFTIGGLLKEAWAKTKGVKATVWAGSAVMYLALIVLIACGAFLLPSTATKYGGLNVAGIVGDILFQLITNAVSVIFSAGLIYIGIRKVANEDISWKMVFEGFTVAGKLIVATILQTLLVCLGLLLLVLPGIYLAIGYAMTIPLVVDRKMSPWQAMETSRKAIHGEWWKMFGLFIVVGLILMVSMLPLGLGLIWTWPMFVVLGGVVYRSLFGIAKRVE